MLSNWNQWISNRSYYIILIFFCLILTSTGYAGWSVKKQVRTLNGNGQYLSFESINNDYIRIRIGERRKTPGVFANDFLIFKIDKNDIREVKKGSEYPNLKFQIDHYVYWNISKTKEPSSALKEFMNGHEVVFQFYRDDGKILEAVFSLDGIKEAIGEILN